MNYQKLHDSIISTAKKRGLIKGQYKESHHILPKSMGGNNGKSNLVDLTAREHFIIHWLLKKIHNNKSMTYAFFSMTKMGNESQKRYTSHSFKYAREAMSILMSERTGEKNPLYGLTGEKSPNFGSKRSESARGNISKSMTGNMIGSRNHKSKPVKNLTTGEVFESIRQAQIKTTGNVSYAVRNGGTAGGDMYSFVDCYGNNIDQTSKLKGYMKSDKHVFSVSILNKTTGKKFNTIKEAGSSVGKTGAAISWAIKNNKTICGFEFVRTDK